MAASRVLLTTLLSLVVVSTINAHRDKKLPTGRVTYDGRSLMINGKRVLLFSGSVHYTRSTPDMWPDILQKAKKGGLNLIQTYVFWNVHEPVQGQYNFTEQYDLVKFIKLVWKHDMYVTLRLGPFIQAEWNHGGLPYWMREVPDITFRTDNGPFKHYMEKYVRMIIEKMKAEKLFAPQGGPIILAQIENEYNHIQRAFRERGSSYVQWAAKLALGMQVGVPWIMCKQSDAPDPVINSCNGRHCGDTFTGPNKPYKPSLWTENWTAQYRAFGDPPSQRSAEDISYSVARFFSRNGTMANYYMYHGGTNFGRTSAHFTTTRYYDEAPLDEYGLQREPKWGHLKDLHRALNLCKKALLWGGVRVSQSLGKDLEATFFERPGTNICAAFLVNNNTKIPQTINFKGENYIIPPRSISILPDCKTVVYNTDTIVAQHSSRNFVRSEIANRNLKWKMYKEVVPSQFSLKSIRPFELFRLTKDATDYAWYSTRIELDRVDLSVRKDIAPVIRIPSLGHAMIVFVNGEYLGSAHGNHDVKGFVFQDKIKLKPGFNQITLLCSTMGFPDSGPYMERVYTGPRAVQLLGLNTGKLDLTFNGWEHQVGLDGEKLGLFTKEGSKKVEWTKANGVGPPLAWYKASFDAPEGKNPVVIRMTGMGKGLVWVNGKSIGRHWMSFLSALGKPSQSEYHIPRAYIKPKDNLLVIFEEKAADPKTIEILVVDRDTICSFMTELHPPHVRSWARQNSHIRPVLDIVKPAAHLKCPNHETILTVEFASWGDPYGACGNYFVGNCSSPISKEVIEKRCLGRTECEIPIDRKLLDKKKDGCPDTTKTLAVQVKCGFNKN